MIRAQLDERLILTLSVCVCVCVCVCAAAQLQEQWEALAAKLNQTQQQIRACEAAMVFAFVEVKTHKNVSSQSALIA